MEIKLNRENILDLETSLKKEYLLTNGLGGYCSKSVLDCLRRKYHGLLIVDLDGKKYNLLNKLDACIQVDKKEFFLSTNKYPNVFYPTGHQYTTGFKMELYPETTYTIGDITVEKSIVMPRGQNAVLIKYRIKSPKKITMRLFPLLSYREIHTVNHENIHIRPKTFPEKNGFKIDPYSGMPPLFVTSDKTSVFYPSPDWWRNMEYLKERNRGYPYQEDLFCPGMFEIKLKDKDELIIKASIEAPEAKHEKEFSAEVERMNREFSAFNDREPLKTFKYNALHYIFDNSRGEKGITAGYHWFGEWGRDSMISFCGLTLCCGRFEEAKNILLKYAKYAKNGRLPNYFSGSGGESYNSIDASLLYFRAVQQYLEKTKDKTTVKKSVLPVLIDIITAFIKNSVPEAALKNDGFLYTGNENTQLTWMDAQAWGKPVTPRHGAAVEINALWYNALSFLAQNYKTDLTPGLFSQITEIIKNYENNFINAFWCEDRSSLADVYRSAFDKNISIRPNQLFALALPFRCVPASHAERIIETIKYHLVTPCGLRTLSPEDPEFQPDYSGDQNKRDQAYHQGTVWPWLAGIFCDALLNYTTDKKSVATYINNTFSKLWSEHLGVSGLLHISEIFKATPPHHEKGAAFQAWSLAEIIRIFDTIGI